jgi:hypothetical protein
VCATNPLPYPQLTVETYATTQRTSSKVTFLILVLYDFIVQNILSSLLLLCYNLMIMNDYESLKRSQIHIVFSMTGHEKCDL